MFLTTRSGHSKLGDVKTQFEQDFRATPKVLSVLLKLPEIKQKDTEYVFQYVSTCAEILLELRTKTDTLEILIQLHFNATEMFTSNAIDEAVKARFTREIKQKNTSYNI